MYTSTSQNSMGGPVVCVGVEALDLKGSCIRLIGQLMDHDPLLVFSDNTDLQRKRERNQWWLIKKLTAWGECSRKWVLYYLSLYKPAWDGCFAVIAWFELQGYWTRADVRDGMLVGGPGISMGTGEVKHAMNERLKWLSGKTKCLGNNIIAIHSQYLLLT